MDDSNLNEIRLVGRGGQGIVTAGELLGRAAIQEDYFAQSIPSFGPERRGAPSFCSLRIGKEPILLKCNIEKPKIVCVFDSAISMYVNVFENILENSVIIYNSPKEPEYLVKEFENEKFNSDLSIKNYKFYTIDATGIALSEIGVAITNTAMMGAFAKATKLIGIESIKKTIQKYIPAKTEANIDAAERAFEETQR